MDMLWLGYDGLDLAYHDIVAVLIYRPALDTSIARAYGSVPVGIRAVVVTAGGAYYPARWGADQLRRRWARWRGRQGIDHGSARDRGFDGNNSNTGGGLGST